MVTCSLSPAVLWLMWVVVSDVIDFFNVSIRMFLKKIIFDNNLIPSFCVNFIFILIYKSLL